MERRCIKEMSGYAAFKEVQMKLNTSIYEKVKYKLTGNGDRSPALDAYAKAYFSEPPITGEWDEESMCEALYMILLNHHFGSLDLRYRSAESILRDRLQSARDRVESAERILNLIVDEHENMKSFIWRFHLKTLYKEHLKNIHAGSFKLETFHEELPFE